ncbi:hypothetical protein PPL_08555 [Heterostelium album PN500]|uniref:Sugar phosphate transporter domain-containing protein n=1 Tax=Heterostelium pallidum (strain ATCC 26659 / Pp 5 / PN500) TaxID=670386 RepID=D3BJ34_HETP5|nr:hypothetical protein PPL_08555 [Heterostelium album PN500]EFA77914.1 hypothetical protein PPL_08555 [Heterostelium album PN500]|eukprot:XP_020430042.1 hypothetical protein PPL_08555 [Heterostelium album PN500]
MILEKFVEEHKGFLVAFGYGVTSVSITFFNKAVLSYYGFDYSNALTLGQMLFSLFFLVIMKHFKMISYPDLNMDLIKKLSSLSLLFILMVVSGLAALAKTNVPLFSALRRLSTLIVIIGERILLEKKTPADEIQSVVLMVVGAMIAGWGDVTFDFIGSIYILFNCFVTAGYLIYIAKKSKETGLNTFGLMFYCNIISIPATIVLTVITEGQGLLQYENYSNLGFQFCFLMSSVQAFLLNYFIFLCSTYNSPLTTSITGQIKSILQTIIGLFMFGDVVLSLVLVYGLLLSTLASFWYTFIKYRQTINRARGA